MPTNNLKKKKIVKCNATVEMAIMLQMLSYPVIAAEMQLLLSNVPPIKKSSVSNKPIDPANQFLTAITYVFC